MSRVARAARVVVQQLDAATGTGWFARSGHNSLTIDGLRVAFRSVIGFGAKPKPAEIKIWNLAERTRSELGEMPLRAHLEAGYEGDYLRRVVSGDVRRSTSARDGTAIVTTLEVAGGDRAWRGASLDRTYRDDAPLLDVVRDAAEACGLALPARVERDLRRASLSGGYTATGGALQQLERFLAGYGFAVAIVDGQLRVLREGQASAEEIVVLGPDAIVGSPTVTRKRRLQFRTPLDPRLVPGQGVLIRGARWVAHAVKHEGDTREGSWHTTCEATSWKT